MKTATTLNTIYPHRCPVCNGHGTVSDIGTKVDRVLRSGYYLLGSLEGTLEAVNLHGRGTFTIWERVTGKPVRVGLTHEMREHIKALLDKRVLVAGRVRYFANGQPRSVVDLTEIRDLETSYTVRAEFGSIPGLTGDMETPAFLKAMRE
jgi:hypothetical protein